MPHERHERQSRRSCRSCAVSTAALYAGTSGILRFPPRVVDSEPPDARSQLCASCTASPSPALFARVHSQDSSDDLDTPVACWRVSPRAMDCDEWSQDKLTLFCFALYGVQYLARHSIPSLSANHCQVALLMARSENLGWRPHVLSSANLVTMLHLHHLPVPPPHPLPCISGLALQTRLHPEAPQFCSRSVL